jgi:hypothetical protein
VTSLTRTMGGYSAPPDDVGRRLAVIYARLLKLAENRREARQAEPLAGLPEAGAPEDVREPAAAAGLSGLDEVVAVVTEGRG